jgi:folate-binding Fe-S cluster repair protein YgfZ
MVNLELVGGVNFQKGCYPGQEVVARSQYRGTLKRRTFLFEVDAPTVPGEEVFSQDDPDQPAGMVVMAAPWPAADSGASASTASTASTQHLALVEVKWALLQGGSRLLHLHQAQGAALKPRDLPYEVPHLE